MTNALDSFFLHGKNYGMKKDKSSKYGTGTRMHTGSRGMDIFDRVMNVLQP
jgi:hypothetical protein